MQWPKLTRRGFLRGVGAATVAGAAISVLPGCTNPAQHSVPEPTVVDTDKAVSILDEYEEVELALKERESWDVPVSSVLRESQGNWIPLTQSAESTQSIVKACAFSLEEGKLHDVVLKPTGNEYTTVIFDVRCSDSVYAWSELDIQTHAWKLLAAKFSSGKLDGSPTTLWETDANYDPPGFVCANNSVLWQVTPSVNGEKTSESSYCYLWKTGDNDARRVVESPGRFPIAPSISGSHVILAPRVRADEGVYYGITAYSLDDDLKTIVDQLVLPHAVRPFYATRVGERFAISIEANYSSGGMFGTMGTYIGPGSGPFIRLSREPSANVAGSGDRFIIKSRTSYFVIDTHKATYSVLPAANRCLDYGEFPARVGDTNDFVTYATVKDEASGYPSAVTVRQFRL